MTPPYHTTPPPKDKVALVKWACYEAAMWPAETPQGCYVYWVRFAEKTRKTLKQMGMELV